MNYDEEFDLKNLIKKALREDTGKKDITTEAVIPEKATVQAILLAKQDFIVCGLGVAAEVFKTQDRLIKFKPLAAEGAAVKKGKILARILGRARSILTAERVALNFLSLLSGISTKTSLFVKEIRPYKARILDTRKTIPGLRVLQKYAVRIGGGYNHRLSLDEMVLIKDNHLRIIQGFPALSTALTGYKIEIEVKDLEEFRQALRIKPSIIMLDNMPTGEIRRAVLLRGKLPIKLEASGGINIRNIKKTAATGIDLISVGELTHSIKAVDICLEII